MVVVTAECLTFGSAMRSAVFLASPCARSFALLALSIAMLSSGSAYAQGQAQAQAQVEPSLPAQPLRVGVFDAPPFAMRNQDGGWEGLSIELWQDIARHRGWVYELRAYDSVASLVKAVAAGEVDVAPAVASSQALEVKLDLSHSYYPSGSGIAVPASSSGLNWMGIFEQLLSWELARVITLLLLLWLTAGAIVWLFERRQNSAVFGERPVSGLGNGIWWAAVTMTTVGYGDKSPRSLGGRVVAVVWMLASIVLIASLTAALTTSLTLEGLSGKVQGVEDLPRVRVGATAGSRSLESLVDRGIAATPVGNEREGLEAVVDGRLDAFVFNVLVLRYLARTEFSGRVQVLPGTFGRYFVKMGLPTGSPLREPLDRTLLEITGSIDWDRRVERYLGSDG